MAKIIPLVLQIIFVAGGVFGGMMLKPKPAPAAVHADADGGAEKAEDKHPPKKVGKQKGHGDDAAGDASAFGGTGFIKFSRQFIVPVIDPRYGNFVLMLDINIEAPASIAQAAYEREPKLRDSLLRSLFTLSNEGRLGEDVLLEENLDYLRKTLLHAAQDVMGEDAQNVLILNIARQKV